MAARADLIVINLIHTVGHVYVALQLVTKLELLSTLRVQIRSIQVQRVWFFLLGGGLFIKSNFIIIIIIIYHTIAYWHFVSNLIASSSYITYFASTNNHLYRGKYNFYKCSRFLEKFHLEVFYSSFSGSFIHYFYTEFLRKWSLINILLLLHVLVYPRRRFLNLHVFL